jgi:hypothetical protein
MKKAFAGVFSVVLLVMVLGGVVHAGRQVQAGQAQVSNQPQYRIVGANNVAAGQPVVSVVCPALVSTTALCVGPITGTGSAGGVAIQSGVPGDTIQVMMTGVVMITTDNQPVLNDIVGSVAGSGHDLGVTSRAQVSNTLGTIGKVIGLVDSTHAWIVMYGPASVGEQVTAASFDATVPAYIQANQNTSTGPQGPQGATGPTGATGAAGASYIKGTSGVITGTLLAVGGVDSGTVSVAGATVGESCGGVTATDGTNPSSSVTLSCRVATAGVVTVEVTAAAAALPASKAYRFVVFP